MIETILADHRRQLTEYDRRLGDTDPAHDARLLRAAPQGDREGDRARERAPAADSRRDHRQLVREPDHPARRDHARSAGRRDAGRRLQQGERAAGGGRQAGRPGHGDGAPPAPSPPAARPRPPARPTSARPRAAPATRPRWRSGRRPNTRARCPRWRASAATRIRRASAATSPATCRRAAPRTSRTRARSFANVGCESCHGPGRQTRRRRRQARSTRPRRPRGDLPRLPHRRRHQRRVRLHEVRPGHRRPGPRWRRTCASSRTRREWPPRRPRARRSHSRAGPAPEEEPLRPPLPRRQRSRRQGARARQGARSASARAAKSPRRNRRRPPRAATAAPAPPNRPGANFETLGTGAVRTQDVARCCRRSSTAATSEKRDLDRARCRATTAYLRRTLPQAHVRVHDRRAGRRRGLGLRRGA